MKRKIEQKDIEDEKFCIKNDIIDKEDDKENDENEMWNVFNEYNSSLEENIEDASETPDEMPKMFKNCTHSETIFDDKGSYEICASCGLIIQEGIIDSSPEWRMVGNSQYSTDPVRCSMINPLLPQSSLSTTIAIKGKSNANSYLLMTMNKWQSMPYTERSMFDVFSYLDEQCRYSMSKAIVHAAKIFYRKVYKKNIELLNSGKKREGLRGKKRKGLISACLFYACKQNNEPRTKQTIADILGIPKTCVTKGCKIFLDLLKDDESTTNENDSVLDVMNAKHFIEQYGKELQLDHDTIRYSLSLYSEMEECGLSFGNQAPSIAAGVLFMMLKSLFPGINESYITNKCTITKVTITNVYRQLQTHENFLLFNVFAKDLYAKLNQTSKITLFKILSLGKYLLLHSNFVLVDHPRLFAATIIYCVMHYSVNSKFDKQAFLKQHISPWTESDLCRLSIQLIFYKQSILDFVIQPIIYPKHVHYLQPHKRIRLQNENDSTFTFV